MKRIEDIDIFDIFAPSSQLPDEKDFSPTVIVPDEGVVQLACERALLEMDPRSKLLRASPGVCGITPQAFENRLDAFSQPFYGLVRQHLQCMLLEEGFILPNGKGIDLLIKATAQKILRTTSWRKLTN